MNPNLEVPALTAKIRLVTYLVTLLVAIGLNVSAAWYASKFWFLILMGTILVTSYVIGVLVERVWDYAYALGLRKQIELVSIQIVVERGEEVLLTKVRRGRVEQVD